MSPWPNVSPYKDRHGHTRWRFRKTGHAPIALQGEPGSPEFMAQIAQARVQGPIPAGEGKVIPGSFSALCAAYYASGGFRNLRPITRATYRNTLERFRAKNGNLPARAMRRQDVMRFLDQKADTPSAANHLLQVLRVLMRFGLDRGMIDADPTHKVRRLRIEGDGFPPWSDEQIETYKAAWKPGTRQRLALMLLLETVQRRGDVVRMGRQHVKGDRLRIRQSKTRTEVSIRISDALKDELDRVPAGQMTFLVTGKGAPFTPAGFGNWFREQCDRAGIGHVSAHGLRKAGARQLAESGCTAHEIMSITGHKTLAEVQRYAASASGETLADAAHDKRKARTDLATQAADNLATLKIV